MNAASGRAIELYQGSPLERVSTKDIVVPRLNNPTRYHLASDIFVSKYGITGFSLVDQNPGQRHSTYTDQEWIGLDCTEDSIPWEAKDDPVRRSHFLDTETGFKMIRYFVLPPNVKQFFAHDEYIGSPMIDKYLHGSLPKTMDEVPADPDPISSAEGMPKMIADIVNTAVPEHQMDSTQTLKSNWYLFERRTYLSFHQWPLLREVLDEVDRSLAKGLAGIDRVIDMHDQTRIVTVRLALPTGELDQPNKLQTNP